ncbi:MAG: hypothetical protein EHM48_03135 [Planctomycetaceae bacterium]|nr:MAG: hypothetical protein EHM48_03135 [Planctomycetaceae bacterium]
MSEKTDVVCPECHGKGRIDIDKFQGCRHYFGTTGTATTGAGSPVNGFPRAAAPVKTWLDECAKDAALVFLRRGLEVGSSLDNLVAKSIKDGYSYAAAMLAEKLRREKVDAENKKGTE